jgi:gluconate 2-dehydrogenase gamma chain
MKITRREFLAHSALIGGSLWLSIGVPRPRASAAAAASTEPQVLTAEQWKTLEAITARIIPTDDVPGAREAGCVNFIDKALANEDAELRPVYEAGLPAIDAVANKKHDRPFVELTGEEQDALLAELQDGKADGWSAPVPSQQFFEAVRVQTIIGFLSDPTHGGNRDYAGWKVVGYPGSAHHRGGYTPAQMIGKERIVPVWESDD